MKNAGENSCMAKGIANLYLCASDPYLLEHILEKKLKKKKCND